MLLHLGALALFAALRLSRLGQIDIGLFDTNSVVKALTPRILHDDLNVIYIGFLIGPISWAAIIKVGFT